jgi:hypothetical protein
MGGAATGGAATEAAATGAGATTAGAVALRNSDPKEPHYCVQLLTCYNLPQLKCIGYSLMSQQDCNELL